MFIAVDCSAPLDKLIIPRIKQKARLVLALFPHGVVEEQLNRYLQKNFNLHLYDACKKIIAGAKYNLNSRHEVIVTIPDPILNTVARIITYGTGALMGSRILKFALGLK